MFKAGDRVRLKNSPIFGEVTGLVDGELSQVLWDNSKTKTWIQTKMLTPSVVHQ